MRRLTWRNLLARKVRLVMSAFAIVLGVAFVAGSLIFTDTLSKSFDAISYGTVPSATVRPESASADNLGINVEDRTLPASLVTELAGVDGAARVDGDVAGIGLFVLTSDDKLLGGMGAPTLSFNWGDAPNANGEQIATISSGRAPENSGEVALDERSAKLAGYEIGDTVRMVTLEENPSREAELVGIVEFGAGGLAGATLVIFDTATAQEIFHGGADVYTSISVTAADGVSQRELADRIAPLLPAGVEVLTGDELAKENSDLFGQIMGFLSTFLLVFAAVALIVGTFLIVNTFSILVAQRSRELALVRALGASRRQVRRSVLTEAFIVGLIGSTLGLGLGFALAAGLKALFSAFGLDLSGTALVFAPSTVIASYAVGIIVTMVAAAIPARRAAKVPPVAAMRDDVAMPESSLHRRAVLAVVFSILGAAGLFAGLGLDVPRPVAWVGGGVFFVLMAVAAASPILATPFLVVFRVIAARLFGRIGLLAAENARRNPRRTAATASALMIGLALVTTMSILGSSINKSIDKGVDEQFTSDFLISNAIGFPFSTAIAADAADVPGVERVSAQQSVQLSIADDGSVFGTAGDPADVQSIFTIDWIAGGAPEGPDQIALSEGAADARGLSMGDAVSLDLPTGVREVQIAGVFAQSYVLGDAWIDVVALEGSGIKRADSAVAIDAADGADLDAVQSSLEALVADNPAVTVQDRAGFAEAQRAQVNQLLYLIYALLGLAIIIAMLGIVNTLGLSVIERTREVGLVRAIGMTRRQVRRMVRLEAVAIAVFGAVLGIGAGLLFGIVLQRSFADEGIEALGIPGVQLAVFVVVSAVVGVIAAVVPAWRASRLKVLDAIATE